MNRLGAFQAMAIVLKTIKTRLSHILKPSETRIKLRQLAEAFLMLIQEGELKAGDHLPNEAALTRGLPFSLGTIQKALRNLSELGVVKLKTGIGTLIAERSEEIIDLWQFRFANVASDTVLPIFSTVTGIEKIGQKGPWSKFLGDEERYVRIEREIDVDR